ncbi:MAG: hypothetical protein AB7I30_08480 [Isosphaeraceae bacterium]
MRRPTLTIARGMVVVAVVAADLALLRLFLSTGEGLSGLGLMGLAVSASLLGAILGRGRVRRFGIGFLVSRALLVGGLFAFPFVDPATANESFLLYVNGVVHATPRSFQRALSSPNLPWLPFALVELAIGLPVIATASLGGFAALGFAREKAPHHAPRSAIAPS